MDIIIWIGAALTALGLFGLLACIVIVVKKRRANLPEPEMRAVLQKVVALNMGALAVSGIGLMMVLVGVILA